MLDSPVSNDAFTGVLAKIFFILDIFRVKNDSENVFVKKQVVWKKQFYSNIQLTLTIVLSLLHTGFWQVLFLEMVCFTAGSLLTSPSASFTSLVIGSVTLSN